MQKDFKNKISGRLLKPLPGEAAQLRMGSGIRMKKLMFMDKNDNTKNSGVLILLYPYNNSIWSVLIVRPEYKGTHSGQVAFPGGKYEKADGNFIVTALREAEEEIGVDRNKIEVLGQLSSLYIPPSNFVVYPTVGFTGEKPLFVPDKNEVKDIIEYPVSLLLKKETVKTKEFHIRKDFSFTAPYFNISGNVVWGATAMILSEFAEIMREL